MGGSSGRCWSVHSHDWTPTAYRALQEPLRRNVSSSFLSPYWLEGAEQTPKGANTERNRQSHYLSMMVGVDALITSWCKIFKPDSHLAASSFESAGEGRGQKCGVTPWEDLCLDTPTPHRPRGWEEPVLVPGTCFLPMVSLPTAGVTSQ